MASYSGRRIAIAVLILGFGVGGLGAWFLMGARPVPGAFIDAVATPDGVLALRHERSSSRDFCELWTADEDHHLRRHWSGLIPPYAGRPGVMTAAATREVATVRVIRGGRPQIFAFDLVHGQKIDSFELDPSLPPSPAAWTLPAVGTTSADAHTIEALATGDGGAVLLALDLAHHASTWRQTLPWTPARVWIVGDAVGASDGSHQAGFALQTGAPIAAPAAPPPGLGDGLTYDPARRELRAAGGQVYALPADAVEPRPYHVGAGLIWIVTPGGLRALATDDLSPQLQS